MSYDLEVYGAYAVAPERLSALVADAGGLIQVMRTGAVVDRLVRGEPAHAFVIEGPFSLEREDLPDDVAAAAVGVKVRYEFTVEDHSRAAVTFARKVARRLAELSGGVVHDRQDDEWPIWPRTARRFKPPAAQRIDTLGLEWFVRREDLRGELPGSLLAALRAWIPEALPRRFGAYEPLRHQLSDDGDAGFVQAWRSESGGLYWKAVRPCLAGSASAVGEAFTPWVVGDEPPLDHPVARLSLIFDLRVLSDQRWRDELVAAFAHIARVTGAFYGQAGVERGWRYGGGSLQSDGETETRTSPVCRDRWSGLPPYPMWLAWFAGPYLPHVGPHRGAGCERLGGGLLCRAGDHPDQATGSPWPADLMMTLLDEGDPRFPDVDRVPARVIPEGL
ncbi:hypothetical protein [Nonomuraea sp. LPB2021202275-12-8]|uniref:hypothetical protein n=1 Tax=Nonomuraea sp. LPB2021202275-12-8 TaxID=3120159 RepID=UPI00300C2047